MGFAVNKADPDYLWTMMKPYVCTDGDASCMTSNNGKMRHIWNAWTHRRASVYWNASLLTPVLQSFPHARLSIYNTFKVRSTASPNRFRC